MTYTPTVRQWSEHVFAAFVPDGMFGRYVGYAHTREEAQDIVQAWLDSGWVGRNMSPSGGSVDSRTRSTTGRHDPDPVTGESDRKRGARCEYRT